MKNLKIGILLMVLCTIFTAIGQLFFKYSSVNFKLNIFSIITNINLILGLFFYALGAGLLIIALKFGNLSVIYPFVSLTFVWVLFISFWFLNESINNFKVSGIIFIVFGVSLMGMVKNGK